MPVTFLSKKDVLDGIRSMKRSAYSYERIFTYFFDFLDAVIDMLVGFIMKVKRDGVKKAVADMLELGIFSTSEYGHIVPFWLSVFTTYTIQGIDPHDWKLSSIRRLIYRVGRDEDAYRRVFGFKKPRVFEKIRERVFGEVGGLGKRELFEATLKRLDKSSYFSLIDSVLKDVRFMREVVNKKHYSDLLIDDGSGSRVFKEIKNKKRASVINNFHEIIYTFFKRTWRVLAFYIYASHRYLEAFDVGGEELLNRCFDRLATDYLIAWVVHDRSFGFEDDMGNKFLGPYKDFVFKLFEGNTVLSDGTRLKNYDKMKNIVFQSVHDEGITLIVNSSFGGFLKVYDRKNFIGTLLNLDTDNYFILFVYFLYAFLFGAEKDFRFMKHVYLFYEVIDHFIYLIFACESLIADMLAHEPPVRRMDVRYDDLKSMFEQFFFVDVFSWTRRIFNGAQEIFWGYISGQSFIPEKALKDIDGEVVYKLVRGGKGRIIARREHFEILKSTFTTVKNFALVLLDSRQKLVDTLKGDVRKAVWGGEVGLKILTNSIDTLNLFGKDLIPILNSMKALNIWLSTVSSYLSKSVYNKERLFVEKEGKKVPFYELKPLELVVSEVKDKFNFFKSYIITSNDVLVNSFINSVNYSISVSDDTEEYHYRVARGDFWREYSAVFDMIWRVMGKSGKKRMSV